MRDLMRFGVCIAENAIKRICVSVGIRYNGNEGK